MKKIICLLFIAMSLFAFSQNEQKFDQGKVHYKESNYEAAISSWESILESGEHSAALYFNLGNAYYRIDQIAPSIYYYEKALQLAPGDSEIKNNLAFAQNQTIDIIEPLPKNLFSSWIERTTQLFSFNNWAKTAVVFIIGFVLLFLLYYFSVAAMKKRLFFISSFLSLFLSLGCVFFAFNNYAQVNDAKTAILFASSSQVRSEPLERADISFVIHEGTKVKIISEEEEWVRIKLADGKDGWMIKTGLKQL
ncbi:MAG: tetratricopeptide repeat protein [Flavobacteriaceae bacterium]|nr:tetratricopeptide repeat protein [Flavobacteriaceae bacterium]